MKFKNLVSEKEVADFKHGDILILKDRRIGKEEVCIISIMYNKYNLMYLHDGGMFSARFKPFEDIQRGVRKWYDIIGVIENEHLELSMIEEYKQKENTEE